MVALNRKILNDGHPGVADSLSDLAELRRAQGKLEEVGWFCRLPTRRATMEVKCVPDFGDNMLCMTGGS